MTTPVKYRKTRLVANVPTKTWNSKIKFHMHGGHVCEVRRFVCTSVVRRPICDLWRITALQKRLGWRTRTTWSVCLLTDWFQLIQLKKFSELQKQLYAEDLPYYTGFLKLVWFAAKKDDKVHKVSVGRKWEKNIIYTVDTVTHTDVSASGWYGTKCQL